MITDHNLPAETSLSQHSTEAPVQYNPIYPCPSSIPNLSWSTEVLYCTDAQQFIGKQFSEREKEKPYYYGVEIALKPTPVDLFQETARCSDRCWVSGESFTDTTLPAYCRPVPALAVREQTSVCLTLANKNPQHLSTPASGWLPQIGICLRPCLFPPHRVDGDTPNRP